MTAAATRTPESADAVSRRIAASASAAYREAGQIARRFAEGKLLGDPFYRAVLAQSLVADGARVLDLGCGPALLFAWLIAAESGHAAGLWPAEWPPAPHPASMHGIEVVRKDVELARCLKDPRLRVDAGDIRHGDFEAADLIVLLDVLHYLIPKAQESVLTRARAALAPGGVLLVRVGDAGASTGAGDLIDRARHGLRGGGFGSLHYRSESDWRAALRACGFEPEVVPLPSRSPYANVLFAARPIQARVP